MVGLWSQERELLTAHINIMSSFDCSLDSGPYGILKRDPYIARLKGRYDISQGESTAEDMVSGFHGFGSSEKLSGSGS
jgi:hypothetical protein